MKQVVVGFNQCEPYSACPIRPKLIRVKHLIRARATSANTLDEPHYATN